MEGTKPYYLTHILYTKWFDGQVPPDNAAVLKLIKLVDEHNVAIIDPKYYTADEVAELNPTPPILINCSKGVGRTGIFTVLTSALRLAGWLPTHKRSTLFQDHDIPDPCPSPLDPLPGRFAEDDILQETDHQREQRMAMAVGANYLLAMYIIYFLAFGVDISTKMQPATSQPSKLPVVVG